jgi:hypothetical protein
VGVGDEVAALYPFVFEGLSEDDAELLREYLDVAPTAILGAAQQLMRDTGPRLPPKEVVYDQVIFIYRDALRLSKDKHQSEVLYEEAVRLESLLLETASHGHTRGEQRVSLLLRLGDEVPQFPAVTRDADHAKKEPLKVDVRHIDRSHRLRFMPARRAVRDYDRIWTELKPILRHKRDRQRSPKQIATAVADRFPELKREARPHHKVIDLSPAMAARIVWGRRLSPAVGPGNAEKRLAEARKVLAYWQRASAALRD